MLHGQSFQVRDCTLLRCRLQTASLQTCGFRDDLPKGNVMKLVSSALETQADGMVVVFCCSTLTY